MATPDQPQPFGYKMAWCAVPVTAGDQVAAAFGLRHAAPAGWGAGIAAVYEDIKKVFVSPPVGRWTLVVGFPLGIEMGASENPWPPLLKVSRALGEAQLFVTHRVVDLHVWARATKGQLVRAYGYLGERGETLYDEGSLTPEEVSLGFAFFDERSAAAQDDGYWDREDLTYPDEDHVMQIARKWSVAPIDLNATSAPPGVGVVGEL